LIKKKNKTGGNIGSPSMRVSECLEVYFTLAGFVSVDKFVLRNPARSVAASVRQHFKKRQNYG
jgi:hypothetical protein